MAACVWCVFVCSSRCALPLAPSPRSGRRRSKRRRGFQLRSRKLLGTARPSSEPIRKARARLERGSVTRAMEKKKDRESSRRRRRRRRRGGERGRSTRVEVPRARPASHPPQAVPPFCPRSPESPEAGACLEREKRRQKTGGGSCSGLGPSGAPLSLPSAMAPPTTFVVPVVALHSASRCLRCGALTINQLAFPLGGSIDRS